MIAIARKNLSSLFSNPNSFLCNSKVLSIHFFSTSRVKIPIPSHEIYDLLVNKHQFSPELASSLAASRFLKSRSPNVADTILSYLKENSFTTSQLERIVICYPRILGLIIEDIQFKFKVFQDLGLSAEEIAKIVSSNPRILHSSTANRMIPSLSKLKDFLGSNHHVVRLLSKSAWFAGKDLEKTVMPNVEILQSCGLPTERIIHFLHIESRCFFIKSDIMRKSVDKAIEFGVSKTSITFIHAVKVFCFMSNEMWEVKLQAFRGLGFSDGEILTIFRRFPSVFYASVERVEKKTKLLLANGKYNISDIVVTPAALGLSIEKKLQPRVQILEVLESKNLLTKWPPIGAVFAISDYKFLKRFVSPYTDEVGEAFDTMSFLKGKITQSCNTCLKK